MERGDSSWCYGDSVFIIVEKTHAAFELELLNAINSLILLQGNALTNLLTS